MKSSLISYSDCLLIYLSTILPQGYDDGYGGEYDDETYEAYDNSYAIQAQR